MDLFSNIPDLKPIPAKKKRGCKYHDRRGQFTDKSTAEFVNLEKQLKISQQNEIYWKRQAERLSAECMELKEKLKNLKNEQTQLQQQEISVTHKSA